MRNVKQSNLSKEEVWKKFEERKAAQAKHDPRDLSKLKYKDTSQSVDENFSGTPLKSFKNIYKDTITRGFVNMFFAFVFCIVSTKFVAEYFFSTKW